jgi:hypothetical protein
MSTELAIITRMVSGTRFSPTRRNSARVPVVGATREAASIQLACALSQFTYRITLAAIQAARDDGQGYDSPEYEQMSTAVIDVGAACLDLINAIHPGSLSTVDPEMLMIYLRDRRIIKEPPAGEVHDLAVVLGVWTGDVAREIQSANELILGGPSAPDMALAPLERAIISCIDLALLGCLYAPSPR